MIELYAILTTSNSRQLIIKNNNSSSKKKVSIVDFSFILTSRLANQKNATENFVHTQHAPQSLYYNYKVLTVVMEKH